MTLLDDRRSAIAVQDAEALFREARLRRRRRRRAMAGTVVALSAIGIGIAAGLGDFGGTSSPSPHGSGSIGSFPTRAQVLSSAGVGLASIHVTMVDNATVDVSARLSFRTRDWVTRPNRVIDESSFGSYQFPSREAINAWAAADLTDAVPSTNPIANAGSLLGGTGVLDVSRLPTAPRLLDKVLSVRGPRSPRLPESFWGRTSLSFRIAELLLAPEVGSSSELDTALCELLADAPGVRSLGSVTTHTGRRGSGYSLTGIFGPELGTPVLVVDGRSGQVLEVRNWPMFGPPLPELSPGALHPGGFLSASTEAIWFDPLTTNELVSRQSVPSLFPKAATESTKGTQR
jgi:hypothetical protein